MLIALPFSVNRLTDQIVSLFVLFEMFIRLFHKNEVSFGWLHENSCLVGDEPLVEEGWKFGGGDPVLWVFIMSGLNISEVVT